MVINFRDKKSPRVRVGVGCNRIYCSVVSFALVACSASNASACGRPWSTMAMMVMFTSAKGSLPNKLRMWLVSSTENSNLIIINVQYIKQFRVVAYKLQPTNLLRPRSPKRQKNHRPNDRRQTTFASCSNRRQYPWSPVGCTRRMSKTPCRSNQNTTLLGQ